MWRFALEIIIDLPFGFPINNIISLCVLGQTNSSNECGDLQYRYTGDSSTVKPLVAHFLGAVLTGYFTVQWMFS